MIALRNERIQLIDSNPFVDHVTKELQEAFEAQCKLDHAGFAITNEEQLTSRKLECIKAGLYALRSIHTAWLKYPAVGGRLEGAPIGVVDFRFTAHSAVAEKPDSQLAGQYARIIANAVDPPMDDFESAPHAQLRVNDCFLAIKKQFMVLFPQLSHEELTEYLYDDEVLSEDEAEPRSYSIQSTSTALHPSSTAAQVMSARGLADAAEDEDDDRQHIVVTGGILRTKAEKRADLAAQVARAKRDETATQTAAARAASTGEGRGRARILATTPEQSESDDEDSEAVETPAKKTVAKRAASSRVKGGNTSVSRANNDQDKADDADPVEQPRAKLTAKSRKRSAPAADNIDTSPKPAPKKRAKSTRASMDTTAENSPNDPSSSSTSGIAAVGGTVAPKIAKRGGAAPKWLKDEDDEVKQLVVDHPDWPMPQIYREYSTRIANTAYQHDGMLTVEYRADFVEFPKGIIVSDKERRKYDIAWRTYESVRQHTEKFKANVSSAKTSPPYAWEPAQVNLAAELPKRPPPPRPDFFNNHARTPVPPVNGSIATVASTTSVAALSTPSANSAGRRRSSRWNAINQAALSAPPATEQTASAARPAVQDSVQGDDRVLSLEDFVAQQSDSSSSAVDEQDVGGETEEA